MKTEVRGQGSLELALEEMRMTILHVLQRALEHIPRAAVVASYS